MTERCHRKAARASNAPQHAPQPNEGATYAKKIEKSESQIWWTEPATVLDCTIRGLSPTPGAWTEARPYRAGAKTERLKILLAEPVESSGVGGNVLKADGELVVACGEGALRILKVQRPGGTPQSAESFLRGFPLKRGSTLWLA